jgi:hypothetical protein
MSKIVKKKDLDVLIESTMSKAGIKKPLIKEEKMGKLYTKVLEKNFAGNWSTPQNDFKKAAVKNFFDKVKKGEANFSDYFDNGGTLTVSEEDFVNEFKPNEVTESKSSKKSLINEDIQKELNNFNKLINYTFKK